MASQIFNVFRQGNAKADIDPEADVLKAVLVMTNTTVDTQNSGISVVGDFSTLDEFDGSGYTRKTLSNVLVNRDDANARIEIDADDLSYTSLGAGTRSVQGILLIKQVTNDTDNIPIAYIEFASVKTPDGSTFNITWNAEGIIQNA